MFNRKSKTLVDRELEMLFKNLRNHTVDSEEYTKVVDRIVTLHKLQQNEKPQQVSPDTWVMAGVNLFGILMIIKHENLNVISSKALSFVTKIK